MKLDDFSNLDPSNIGNWPIPVKIVMILVLCVAALGAGYYFDTQEQLDRLEVKQKKELELREEFKTKQWKAATLPKLKEQLAEIEKSLSELQRRLPSKAEVAGLIQDISQAAIASGLKSELFQPEIEKSDKGVYVKLPIKLRLSGDYHSFGRFISDVAAMPRIVTQHDVIIKPDKVGSDRLMMDVTAQIYRYLEDDPNDKDKNAKTPPSNAPPKK